MSDCVFCGIAAGTIPASVVSETDVTLAFLDLYPMTPGHTVVIPRLHVPLLAELDPEVGAAMFREGMRVAAAIERAGLRAEGFNLFLSDREAAGQEIGHVHLHVLPRFAGDGVAVTASFGRPSREELDEQALAVRTVLADA